MSIGGAIFWSIPTDTAILDTTSYITVNVKWNVPTDEAILEKIIPPTPPPPPPNPTDIIVKTLIPLTLSCNLMGYIIREIIKMMKINK